MGDVRQAGASFGSGITVPCPAGAPPASKREAKVSGSSVSGRELVHGRPVRGDAEHAADRDERRVDSPPAGRSARPIVDGCTPHDPGEHPPAELTAPLAGPPQPLAETPAERVHAVELGELPVVILDDPLCRMPLAPAGAGSRRAQPPQGWGGRRPRSRVGHLPTTRPSLASIVEICDDARPPRAHACKIALTGRIITASGHRLSRLTTGNWRRSRSRHLEASDGPGAGPITGTKDEDYNIIGFTEACLNNVLRLETSGRPPLCRAIPAGKRKPSQPCGNPHSSTAANAVWLQNAMAVWSRCGLEPTPRSEKPWTKNFATRCRVAQARPRKAHRPLYPLRRRAGRRPGRAANRLVRVEASESKRQPARLYPRPGPTDGAAPTAAPLQDTCRSTPRLAALGSPSLESRAVARPGAHGWTYFRGSAPLASGESAEGDEA